MPTIGSCLWFDGQAEAAAELYTSIFPNSRINGVHRAAADNPSTPKDAVLTVDFTVLGHRIIGLNGGPQFRFNEAISLVIDCDDQAEVDRYWDALTADGGEPGPCGWLKDRFGLSWQVTPRRLVELLGGPDPEGAERAMKAMLAMSKIDIAAIERAYAGEAVASAT
jgi:predicted 3-demethylubiquinone-9 3-methyltransferase (glyoxalase superfamily)